MLRNVLANYLDNVEEREFDLPFLALLPALGFYDVHYTHGQVEYGKDFIAKKTIDEEEIQFSFQLKAGDISQSTFRNDIMAQMLECLMIGLSHPNFNKNLPHQAILVTTGRLKGNASLELQDLNNSPIVQRNGFRSIRLWDREQLICDLITHALGGLHRATVSGYASLSSFYTLYGKSLQKSLSEREVERHSRYWMCETDEREKKLLGAAIESEIIASQFSEHGLLHEAMYAHLTALRVILKDLHNAHTLEKIEQTVDLYERSLEKLRGFCRLYYSKFREHWHKTDMSLARTLSFGPGAMFTYLVHCARILEICGFLYFLEDDAESRKDLATFMETFISREPGCAHIPSDRYAVSLVLPVMVLHITSHESACKLLHNTTVWLCDRSQEDWGLAPLPANPYQEITTVLGPPFEFIPEQIESGSLLATLLSDLSAFLGEKQLYSDIVNDIKACGIQPCYWQIPDTDGLFSIEANDVISYPYVDFDDNLVNFQDFDYADHVKYEPQTYKISEIVGPLGLMTLMLTLRDRYFPTVWSELVKQLEQM